MNKYSPNAVFKRSTPKKLPTNLIRMDYNISNDEKKSQSVLKKAASAKFTENQGADAEKVKFPAISPKPSNKFLADKSNELNSKIKNEEIYSVESIPNQLDLMVSNLKINPGVRYSDNSGNIKTNENKFSSAPMFPESDSLARPIRMSRSDYMNLVKSQGNFIRKKYVSEEAANKPFPHSRPEPAQISLNQKKVSEPKGNKFNKFCEIDAIDEKSLHMENDNSGHAEPIEKKEVIDRVGGQVYQHNQNNGKKKIDNVIINNPIYLKELLLCD